MGDQSEGNNTSLWQRQIGRISNVEGMSKIKTNQESLDNPEGTESMSKSKALTQPQQKKN
jgi:hypothetical protein